MCILKVLGSDQKTKNGLIKDLLQENKKQNTKFKHNNCTYIKIKPKHCCDQYNLVKIRVKKKHKTKAKRTTQHSFVKIFLMK